MTRARWSLALLILAAANSRMAAQRLQLELRPRAGDTLRMRLDQITEMSGTRKGAAAKSVVTTLHMFSRAIVESTTPTSALIVAITDSVNVNTSDEHTRPLAEQTIRQLEGRTLRLRLSPDGTVAVAGEAASVPREVNEIVSIMPASFPRDPVAVGDTWVREMPIPPGSRLGVPAGSVVRSSFRLDSLGRRGDVAYVSMHGTLQRTNAPTADGGLGGSVNGTMVVDRRRGWLSESRFIVQLQTTVISAAATAAPTQVRMKIT